MKNRFYFFLFLGFLSWKNSKAQAYIYHTFPNVGAIWYTAYVDQPGCIGNPCSYDIYYLGKDTVLNNLSYRLIYQGGLSYNGIVDIPTFKGLLIRDDTLNKKVFIRDISPTSGDELFYDFNLNVGDTLPDGYISAKISGIYVTGIDSVILGDGTYRKRFKLNCSLIGTYTDSLCLIEGIGYTGGLLTGIAGGDGWEAGVHLACNSYQGTTLYDFVSFGLTSCDIPAGIIQLKKPAIELTPNPIQAGGTISLKGITENYSFTISNVLGQIIFSIPVKNSQTINLPGSIKSGIYICHILTQDNLLITKKLVVL